MNEKWAWIGNGLGMILTAVQTNVIFQYISLFLTILATLLSIVISFMTIYRKFKNGDKITQKDIEELQKQLEEANEKIKQMGEENGSN